MNLPKTWLCTCCPLISLLLKTHQELSINHMTKTNSITWLSSLTGICLLEFFSTQLLQYSQFDPGSLQGLSMPASAPLLRLCPQPWLPSPSHTAWPHPKGFHLPQNSTPQ